MLDAVETGKLQPPDQLLALVYTELRKLAACKLAGDRAGDTLQPTALVHEAWLRIAGENEEQWRGRAHFFGAAAEAMRRILVERARRKKRLKRGGKFERVEFDEDKIVSPLPDDQLLALDEALNRLSVEDPRAAEVIKLCFFVGLTQAEAAKHLGLSLSTVERSWTYARAWLFREIRESPPSSPISE